MKLDAATIVMMAVMAPFAVAFVKEGFLFFRDLLRGSL